MVAILFFVLLRYDVPSLLAGAFTTDSKTSTTSSQVILLPASKSMPEFVRVLSSAITAQGQITKLIMEDSKIGEGKEVVKGSRVTVHYVGALQSGEQFDNSYAKGEPYTFTVGGDTVIKGWDLGLIGMKEGGERVLVVPPQLAYGDREVEKIPKNATLLFAIELIKVE